MLFVVCCVGLFVFLERSDSPLQSAHAQTVAELEQQKADLAAKQEELEAKRSETAETLEEQRVYSALIREQIDAKLQEIALNQQLIDELDGEIAVAVKRIADQEALIVDLEEQITATYNQLRSRLRSISKTNTSATAIQLILGSNSYSDYLISFKLSERIAENDQRMMDSLESDITVIAAAKAQNEADKLSLEAERSKVLQLQVEMEAGKLELKALYAESEAVALQMAADIEYLNEQIAEITEQQDQLQDTIDQVLAEIAAEEERKRQEAEQQGGSYQPPTMTSGKMVWPAPTCKVITSSYKYRPEYGGYHKGIDIARYGNAEGHSIVAAADGTVLYSNRYDTWGSGYGLYVFIDHGYNANGQRVLTVYAHCSRVDVYAGQEVKAGEQIALIGNTGKSDGAHLHFEVQVDGVDTDPVGAGYLSIADVDVLA
ncbi:MAG: peptidoglycan DD-metalloendopeptidase family protein [Clostridia bacterium]|nr:peptidoglycan DD-metalloendopeptidase family protein [Clostridia bacterium]